jgi:hypothetical protein
MARVYSFTELKDDGISAGAMKIRNLGHRKTFMKIDAETVGKFTAYALSGICLKARYSGASGLCEFPGRTFFRRVLFGIIFPEYVLNQSAVFGDGGFSGKYQLTGRLLE